MSNIYKLVFTLTIVTQSCLSYSIDFEDYDDDVAALLREYQQQSNLDGSYTPSILTYSVAKASRTIVDFERGMIYLNAPTPET